MRLRRFSTLFWASFGISGVLSKHIDTRSPPEPSSHIEEFELDNNNYDDALSMCDGVINCEIFYHKGMDMYLPRHKEGMGPGSKWYEENVEPYDYEIPDNRTDEERETGLEEYLLALENDDEELAEHLDQVSRFTGGNSSAPSTSPHQMDRPSRKIFEGEDEDGNTRFDMDDEDDDSIDDDDDDDGDDSNEAIMDFDTDMSVDEAEDDGNDAVDSSNNADTAEDGDKNHHKHHHKKHKHKHHKKHHKKHHHKHHKKHHHHHHHHHHHRGHRFYPQRTKTHTPYGAHHPAKIIHKATKLCDNMGCTLNGAQHSWDSVYFVADSKRVSGTLTLHVSGAFNPKKHGPGQKHHFLKGAAWLATKTKHYQKKVKYVYCPPSLEKRGISDTSSPVQHSIIDPPTCIVNYLKNQYKSARAIGLRRQVWIPGTKNWAMGGHFTASVTMAVDAGADGSDICSWISSVTGLAIGSIPVAGPFAELFWGTVSGPICMSV